MNDLTKIAWHRFGIITSIIGDMNARIISVLFYFTILVPFGIGSRLLSDPMRLKGEPIWLDREPVPTDLNSAKQQG